jgi:hypothetical protein
VLHVLPISVFLIWSLKLYLVRSTEHKAPQYVVFSTPLLPPAYEVTKRLTLCKERHPNGNMVPCNNFWIKWSIWLKIVQASRHTWP